MAGVVGVGLDLVEVERIRRLLRRTRERLVGRLLSAAEYDELKRRRLPEDGEAAFVAGRFAAKEAVGKALGTGVGRLGWTNISITGGPDGQPACSLGGRAFSVARRRDVDRVLVSITHTGGFVAAFAVALGREQGV